MLMEFTPRDWFMMRIGLVFREGEPDPEDPWVRSYLHAQQLVPRHLRSERNVTASLVRCSTSASVTWDDICRPCRPSIEEASNAVCS